ncbi:hypothetical protein ACM26W_11940 [Halomonas sp. HK25]|uniref:hypothetical protein n=1 Tax=Halomonas sp. HK25 TaxID=3394321 RepID=UPI0039FCA79C
MLTKLHFKYLDSAEVMLLFILLARILSAPTANLSFFLLSAYAITGRFQAIQALAMSWLFTMMNPGIAPSASVGVIGRYAVFFAAAISVIYHSGLLSGRLRVRTFTLFTVCLGGFFVGHSFFISPMVDVSVLKAISWTLVMATLIAAWLGLTEQQHARLSQQLFTGLVVIFIVSLPLVVLPLGYLRNGSGFQGIMNHPQAFGPTMALLGAWAASRMFGEQRPSWSLVGLVGGCLVVVLLSEARTAGLAMVLGVGLSILFGPGFSGMSISKMVPGLRSKRVWSVIFLILSFSLLMAPTVESLAQNYITKSGRSDAGTLLEAYDRSRGGLIEIMLANIAERPFTGIGFGIASEPDLMKVDRDPIFNLPVSASIEKGVAPLAILEELGVFGASFVGFWVLWLLRGSSRSGLAPFAVCITALVLNMGESTLFSPGGMGLLSLILFAWAFASGKNSRREYG